MALLWGALGGHGSVALRRGVRGSVQARIAGDTMVNDEEEEKWKNEQPSRFQLNRRECRTSTNLA